MDKKEEKDKKNNYSDVSVDDLLREIEGLSDEKAGNAMLGSESLSNNSEFMASIHEDVQKAVSAINSPEKESVEFSFDCAEKNQQENSSEKTKSDTDKTDSERKKSVFRRILDEDPETIISERSEKSEKDGKKHSSEKRKIYAVLGAFFTVFACFGICSAVSVGKSYFNSFTSGEARKEDFAEIIYPAVIMDIEPFENVSELSSEQVVTASIWSMIMSEDVLSKYSRTFDVVSIPSADVEAYAVRLFGDGLSEFHHETAGPAESRFYYNDTAKIYNVPVAPVVFTYSPEIVSVSRDNNTYTLIVDYVDELPEWMEKTVSKTVKFTLDDTDEGYRINSVSVISSKDTL